MSKWFVKKIYIIKNQTCCFPRKKEEITLNDKVAEIKDDINDNQNKAQQELDLSKINFLLINK